MIKKLLFTLFIFLCFGFSYSQTMTQPSDYEICDDDNDGFASFDMSAKDVEILCDLEPLGYSIAYYETKVDAEYGIHTIPLFYTNLSNTKTIYVSIVD